MFLASIGYKLTNPGRGDSLPGFQSLKKNAIMELLIFPLCILVIAVINSQSRED